MINGETEIRDTIERACGRVDDVRVDDSCQGVLKCQLKCQLKREERLKSSHFRYHVLLVTIDRLPD